MVIGDMLSGGMFSTDDIYEITLPDGIKITDLTLNGNNFVSQSEITESIFEDNLSEVTITNIDTGYTEHHTNMELIQVAHYDDGWYFIIRDIPEEELYRMKIRGDLEYLAMMADVEL